MYDIHSGVQTLIKQQSSNAENVYCVSPTKFGFNDAAESCAEMKAFLKWWKRSKFFVVLVPRTGHYRKLLEPMQSFTLKRLSSTRWECRHKSVITLINQYLTLLKTLHLNFTYNYGKFRQNSGQIADKCHKSSFLCCRQTTPVNVRKPLRIIRISWWNCCI